jgi:hypothetical protein
MSALLLQFWPYIAGAVASLLGLWKVYAMGKASQKAKQAQADAAAHTEAQKIDDAVAGRAPDDNRKELGKWSRS